MSLKTYIIGYKYPDSLHTMYEKVWGDSPERAQERLGYTKRNGVGLTIVSCVECA
jgi:hypothetical protein